MYRDLNGYEILTKLAVGGMSEIYLARAPGLESFAERVVLKKLIPRYAAKRETVLMFLDEARLTARLRHENIVRVFDAGMRGDDLFIVMEYLHGIDARSLMFKAHSLCTPIPLEHALTIFVEVASGLHYAHTRTDATGKSLGIIHRDISPSNIFLTYQSGVKLMDFGIAKAAERSVETRVGICKGKIGYMSPEQLRGEELDQRSDIFLLGIVLFELTTSSSLFGNEYSDYQIMFNIMKGDIPRPSSRRPDYPPELENIVLRAMAHDPDDRYATAGEMRSDVERFAEQQRIFLSTAALARYVRDLFDQPAHSWLSPEAVEPGARPGNGMPRAEDRASDPTMPVQTDLSETQMWQRGSRAASRGGITGIARRFRPGRLGRSRMWALSLLITFISIFVVAALAVPLLFIDAPKPATVAGGTHQKAAAHHVTPEDKSTTRQRR